MKRLALLLAATATLTLLLAVPAWAAPVFDIHTSTNSTAAPGGTIEYFVIAANVGEEKSADLDEDGIADEPLHLQVTLPPGLTGLSSSVVQQGASTWDCSETDFSLHPTTIECANLTVTDPRVTSLRKVKVRIKAAVDPAASGVLTSRFEVTGGGAAPASALDPTLVTTDPPAFGIDAFDSRVSGDAAGSPYTQAGGHPYAISTAVFFDTLTNPIPSKGQTWPVEPAKDILVDLPPGFSGDPSATSGVRCSLAELSNSNGTDARPLCPPGSQIGVTTIFTAEGVLLGDPIPVFNVDPPPGVPARFGFSVGGSVVTLDGAVRSGGDYGLSVNVRNVPEGLALAGTELTFWGTPADPSHDVERACPGEAGPAAGGPICTTDLPLRAFLRNPTSCAGPQPTTMHADSWFHPGALSAEGTPLAGDPSWRSATVLSHNPPGFPASPLDPTTQWGEPQGTTGCDKVPFEPSITVRATSHAADTPTGLDVDLTMPQSSDPDEIDQADVRSARTSLPLGMVVNPAAAAGLVGCSQADVGLDNGADPKCPDASKIGSVEIDSPQLEDPLVGSIYQAKQFDNPAHSLLAFYTVAKGPGLIIKLAAHVEADPVTGRLTTVFEDDPQLPFDHYRLHFNDGPRAALINPPTCGTAVSHSVFTSWARPGEGVVSDDSFQITSGPNGRPCPNGLGGRPFDPRLEAGVSDPLAGATSPFALTLSREDGEQRLRDLTLDTPPGLSAYLKGVPYCPDAAIAAARARSNPGDGALELAAPSCPAASQIGTVSAGAGAGPIPYHVNTGRVYLAGPYKGAPLSLAIVVPAVAGPLDLGNVVVRAAAHVDPSDAHLRVLSDPLPQIIHGIPLDVRSVYVAIDRPRFTLAPTSCRPMSVDGALGGSDGAAASPSTHFQVAGCGALGFKPRLGLSLEGKTNRGAHPAFRAVLRARPGDANIGRAAVALPHSEFLDQAHIRTVCTRVQFAADACPPGSVYGHARAITPLLDQPLEGPVYLRSSNHRLPDLVAALRGQIEVDLDGRIDTVRGGIRNIFAVVPDAPVTKFVLKMKGGAKGLLQNSRNLCAGDFRASAVFEAQNGRARTLRPLLANDCGGKARKQHRRRR
jgi:hypothetical protein